MRRKEVLCVMMFLIVGIIVAHVGTVHSMNVFRRGVNAVRSVNAFKSAGANARIHTGRGGVGSGGGMRVGGGKKPVYRPGNNPSRPPKYPIVRVPRSLPRPPPTSVTSHPAFEFGKFALVPEVPIVMRLYQPIGFDSIRIMFHSFTREKLVETIAKVAKRTGKKGIGIISATIALGASISLIKAFENRRIVETFPGSASGELVDESAVNDVLERWTDRILEMSSGSGDDDLREGELVKAFVEAFGYDEMIVGISQHDVEMAGSVLPQSMMEIHAMAYEIQKVIYDAFLKLRKELHGKNVDTFGALFAPLAEVMQEAAVDVCFGSHQLRDLKEGYDLGEKLDKKIHQTISDAMKRDWKAFALDLGGAGGVFSILYKFISSDVRKVIEESYDDILLVFDSLKVSLNVRKLNKDLNAIHTQAAEAMLLYETILSSSKSSDDDVTLETDVKEVFVDLAHATTHLRSVITTFPHVGHLKGLAKAVISRSKVGLKAFEKTFKFVEKHIVLRRHQEDSKRIQFVLVLSSEDESTSTVDVTEPVLVVLDACRSHENIGDDTRRLMAAMHGVMSQVLQHIPVEHREQWKLELIFDAIKDESRELAKHAHKVVFEDVDEHVDERADDKMSSGK